MANKVSQFRDVCSQQQPWLFYRLSYYDSSADAWLLFLFLFLIRCFPISDMKYIEIRKLREDMWTHVKTRRHAITKVFPARFGENGNNETECELMLFGDVSYITKNNESSAFPFAAHGILKKSLEGEPVEWKYQYYRVWLQKD